MTLEKGKGLIVGKLRTIYNYGSRLYYLIEDAILEKRICYDNSLLNQEQTIHNIINLKLYYDR